MKKHFKFALLAMAAIGLVACSDDDVTGGNSAFEEDGDGYVTFRINRLNNDTRAEEDTPEGTNKTTHGNFSEGTEDEYTIVDEAEANRVFFFDADGIYITNSTLYTTELGSGDSYDNEHSEKDGERNLTAHITGNGISNVSKCVVVLNAAPTMLQAIADNVNINSLENFVKELDQKLGSYKVGSDTDAKTYFTMSNSVYIKNDELLNYTPINAKEQICKSPEEASKHPIVVHVERVLAKFSLTNKATQATEDATIYLPTLDEDDKTITIKDGDSEVDYEWGVKVLGWGVNGTETETYLVKKLSNVTAYGNWGIETNGDIWSATHWGWNDPSRVRSYWAEGVHYNTDPAKYPQQFRKNITDLDMYWGQNDDETGLIFDQLDASKGYVLNYTSYDSFKNNNKEANYAPENTIKWGKDYSWTSKAPLNDKYEFRDNNFMRTSTHILIAAEMWVKENNEWKNPGTLYQFGSTYWKAKAGASRKTNDKVDYNDMPEQLKYNMLDLVLKQWASASGKGMLYKKVGKDFVAIDAEEDFDAFFEVGEATLEHGDGRVMIRMIETAIPNIYLKGGEQLNADDALLTSFKEDYLYTLGTARRFDGGAMYYAIPIQHMMYSQLYAASGNEESIYEYNIGSYGVVRNHWYQVNITKFTKPGTSVDDPDQPIIPNDDPEAGSFVAFEIVILPWHVVSQDAEL